MPELAFDGSLSLTREMHSSASAWPAWLPLPVQWEGYALKEGNTVLMVALSALALLWGCWNLGVLLFGGSKKKAKPGPLFLAKKRVAVPLIAKENISHDTRRFRFGLPSPSHVMGLPVGQHVTLYAPNVQGAVAGEWNQRVDEEAGEAEVERKYTPVTSNAHLGYFDLVIKVYAKGVKEQFPDGGKMSQYLDSLTVGVDTVDIKGPFGRVEYMGRGKFEVGKKPLPLKTHLGFMAGGTGITPVLQVIAAVLADPKDTTQLSLIYANQSEDDILTRTQLEALAQAKPQQFKLFYTVDRPTEGWTHGVGFITPEMIQAHLPPPAETTQILMCGPPPMIKFACQANLDKLGYTKESQTCF